MTYSIVARDHSSGELGVAVQSHWFSVGSVVTWARPGVGAVATQSVADPSYGPRSLALLGDGIAAPAALERLVAEDAAAAVRQVAVIDAAGTAAVHTGERCVGFAGHVVGEQVSCQANMMASATVWPAMLAAYESAEGPLARRLLAALDAAEAEGGDARGRQSAALLVVPAAGDAWQTSVTLRVEDDPEPLTELRRLLDLADAYALAGAADEEAAAGRHEQATELYRRARKLAPGSHELLFWAALGAAQAGDMQTAVAGVREAISRQPGWLAMLARLPPELAPSAAAVLARIQDHDDGSKE
jgi:uncharacterized Ntn-hydrolase superfamily protein